MVEFKIRVILTENFIIHNSAKRGNSRSAAEMHRAGTRRSAERADELSALTIGGDGRRQRDAPQRLMTTLYKAGALENAQIENDNLKRRGNGTILRRRRCSAK